MQPLLILTGAAGMIGSGVLRRLNDLGRTRLLLVDDLRCTDKWKNLVGKEFIDLCPRRKLFEWLRRRGDEVEGVIHLGACSNTLESNADYLMENNFRFSIRLAEWALSHNKRFVYASSAATYGDGQCGFCDDETLLEELRPINAYAFSKHLVDLWMRREGGLKKAVGLKYFNIFGPNEYHKGPMASMVLKMVRHAQEEGCVHLYRSNDLASFSDGEQRRDFLYLKDAVRMTCQFLEPDYRDLAGIYNIGLGQATAWNALADAVFQALGQKVQISYVDMPRTLNQQYQNYTCADMRKFHRVFPAFATTPVSVAVREYVQDYLLGKKRW